MKLAIRPRRDDTIGWSPETENQLPQPTENPTCPEHGLMVPYTFEPWEISQPVKSAYRCANLTCGIVFIESFEGDEGFYVLEDGELAPYR